MKYLTKEEKEKIEAKIRILEEKGSLDQLNELVDYLNTKTPDISHRVFLTNPNDKDHVISFDGKMKKDLFYTLLWDKPIDDKAWGKNIEKLDKDSIVTFFSIVGAEGTGKTTSLNALLYYIKTICKEEKRGYNRLSLDFNADINGLNFLGQSIFPVITNEQEPSEVLRQFYALIIYGLYKTINEIYEIEAVKERSEFINHNKLFFDALEKELKNNYNPKFSHINKLFNKIKNRNIDKIMPDDFKNDLWSQIKMNYFYQSAIDILGIMDLTTYLQLSLAYFYTDKKEYYQYNLYWTFDNIEHFIKIDRNKGVPIYDEEIVEILEKINNFNDRHNNLLGDFSYNGKYLSPKLKIVLVVRYMTKEMLYMLHSQATSFPPSLKINDFFNILNIIETRRIFFGYLIDEKIINKESKEILSKLFEVIEIVKELMQDERDTERGIKNVLSNMFNQDIRRAVRFLLEIFEDGDVAGKYKTLIKINPIYLDSTEIIRIKRRTVINLIFKKLMLKKLFHDLEVVIDTNNGIGQGLSYTRQILTYLNNVSYGDKNGEELKYCSMKKFITALVKHVPIEKKDEHIEHVALILYNMQSFRTYDGWNKLIDMKLEKMEKLNNDKELFDLLKSEYHKKGKKYEKNYEIRITDAGHFFAFILDDFEYFSSRYVDEMYPLFFETDLNIDTNTSKAIGNGLTIIKKVTNNAIKCIRTAQLFDRMCCGDNYKQLHENSNYLWENRVTHPQRVIDNFIGYLDVYRRYILQSESIDNTIKESVSKTIIQEIEKLVDVLEELATEKDEINKIFYLTGNSDESRQAKKYKTILESFSQKENDVDELGKIKIKI